MIHLCTHINPDGDAIGVVFGAASILRVQAREVTVHLFGDTPRWFGAVWSVLGSPAYTTEPVPAGAEIWLLDCNTPARCGAGNVPADVRMSYIIDHHPDLQTPADRRLIREDAASACEMLVQVADEADLYIPPDAASWLSLGIRTDTLGLSTASVSSDTLNALAICLDAGARYAEICAMLHRSMTRTHLAFVGAALAWAAWDGDTVLIPVIRELRKDYGVGENDCKAILALTGQLLDTDLTVLLIEADDGATLCSARSVTPGRAQALARRLGGDGHPSAAGARVGASLGVVLERVRGWRP